MKKIVSIVLAVSMLAVCVTGCKTTTRKQLKPVVLNEVAHSIFYAPQYAAIETPRSVLWDLRPASTSISRVLTITP